MHQHVLGPAVEGYVMGEKGKYVFVFRQSQQTEPDDFVIATGEMHSVREFLSAAFGLLDLDWKDFVEIFRSVRGKRSDFS